MSINPVGSPIMGTSSGTGPFTTASKAWTAGNFIILGFTFEDHTTLVTAVGNSGGGFSFQVLTQPSPDGVHSCLLYAENIPGGTYDITITFTTAGSSPFVAWDIQEYSGLLTSSSLDQQNTGFDGGSPSVLTSTGTVATGQNDEILFAYLGLYGSKTIVTGAGGGGAANWTAVSPASHGTSISHRLCSRILTATGTYQVVGTSGNADALELSANENWTVTIAAFKADTGGGGGPSAAQQTGIFTQLASGCVIGRVDA
jgi:hypothetical protein